jgi:RNA methyltransferase, TrmH family
MRQDVTRLTSVDNPRVRAAARLAHGQRRRESGLFAAEGPRLAARALAAGLRLRELFYDPDEHDPAVAELVGRVLSRPGPTGTAVYEVTARVMASMAYRGGKAEGVLGIFEQPTWTLADVPVPADRPALWLIAVGLAKPGNLGAMARSAAAAGADALIAADAVVDAFNPNALRAGTGAMFTLPIVCADRTAAAAACRTRGLRIVAAAPDGMTPLYAADLSRPTALVVGPEDTGLDEAWRAAADALVHIPMPGTHAAGDGAQTVDSLNASVAAGVLLFEVVRQRSGGVAGPRASVR